MVPVCGRSCVHVVLLLNAHSRDFPINSVFLAQKRRSSPRTMAFTSNSDCSTSLLRDPSFFKPQSEEEILNQCTIKNTEIIKSCEYIEEYGIPDDIINIISSFSINSKIGKMGHIKQKCIAEILVTEYQFIRILNHYKKYYIDALDGNTKILNKKLYAIVCPKQIWNSLVTLNTLFYNQLYDKLNTDKFNHFDTGIGNIFDQTILTYSNVYISYVAHYITNGVNEMWI